MILCVGTTPALQRSLTFPSLVVDEVNRATEVKESSAGKGINVARVLHLLGHEVLATGFLGGDTGRFMKAELDRQGVPSAFVEVPFRSRICTTIIDKVAGTTTELVEESEKVEGKYWQQLKDLVASHLPKAQCMMLSGGLPPGSPQDFYAECCRMAQPHKVPVIMDARGEPLRLAMQYHPVMVKPNRSELASTFSLKADSDEELRGAMTKLIELGTKCVLVTMGGQGAILSDGSEFWRIPAPKIELNNPIGSGDSVAAGFASGLIKGKPLMECAKLAIACGSANALTPVPGMLYLEDVDRLLKEIQVTKW